MSHPKKNSRSRTLWYEVTQGPARTSGKRVRYYVLTCRGCGCKVSLHANTLHDESMRKYFQRKGWEVGKATTAHRCPNCLAKPRATPPMVPAMPVKVKDLVGSRFLSALEQAWTISTEAERRAFYLRLLADPPGTVVAVQEQEAVVETDAPLIEEQSEPAEWWAELNSERTA